VCEEEFEKFWLSTGGKPGANRLYCLAGWKAHREFAALKPSPNSDMVQFTASQLYGAAKDAGLHNADIDDLISVIGKQHQ